MEDKEFKRYSGKPDDVSIQYAGAEREVSERTSGFLTHKTAWETGTTREGCAPGASARAISHTRKGPKCISVLP